MSRAPAAVAGDFLLPFWVVVGRVEVAWGPFGSDYGSRSLLVDVDGGSSNGVGCGMVVECKESRTIISKCQSTRSHDRSDFKLA
jgi:hypothetical protein